MAKAHLRPVAHRGAADAEPLEQPRHAVLRMRLVLQDLGPGFVVHVPVQSRQNDTAPGQGRDDGEQVGGRRYASGGAGRDDRSFRRLRFPGRRQVFQQPVAPVGRVETAFGGQHLRPIRGDEPQELQRLFPVERELERHERLQRCEGQALRLHAIDQPRQLSGEPHGVVGGHFLVPCTLPTGVPLQDAPGEQQEAALLGNRRRQLGALEPRPFAEGGEVGLDIADRLHARQQQRPAFGHPEKALAQGAAGAARRQENGVARERKRLPAAFGENARRQRVDERRARRDGIEAVRRRHFLRSARRAKKSSVRARSSGVPT